MSVGDTEILFAAMKFDLFVYLVANRREAVEKRELLNKVWGGVVTGDGILAIYMRRPRGRVEPSPDNPMYVCTMWGRRYHFYEGGASLKTRGTSTEAGKTPAKAGERPTKTGETL